MQVEEIRTKLAARRPQLSELGVAGLSLFGSHARGEARADSDFDLLVRFDGPANFDAFMNVKFLLEEILGRPVDLVTADAVRPRLRSTIDREAVSVA